MSEATAPTTGATPETSGSGVAVGPSTLPSLDERSAAAFGMSEPAGEAGESPPPGTDASAAGSGEPDPAAKARADRRAALKRIQEDERGRVDAMAAIRERDELRQRLAAAEERQKQYETRIDPASLTKEQFFALAEKNPHLSPQELATWLRETMANPELAAARAATATVDPKLAALEKKLADQQAMIDGFLQEQTTAAQQAEEQRAASEFFQFTEQSSEAAPYAAWYLKEYGSNHYYELARHVAKNVPPHAGPQAILDEVEETLHAAYSRRPPETGAQQRRQAPSTPQNHAAAQAPTHVSNTLAQQRSSVVDEDQEWASLPFEERSARLFR